MNSPDVSQIKSRLKIAVLIRRFVTTGGAEKYAVEVTKRLAKRHDVHVFAQQWSTSQAEDITFHKVPTLLSRPSAINQLLFSFFTGRAVDDSFDIIHSHERVTRFDVLTVHCACYRGFITEKRGRLSKIGAWLAVATSLRHLSYLWLEKKQFSYRKDRRFIVVSKRVKKDVQANYWLPDYVFHLAYPGVDMAYFGFEGLEGYRLSERRRFNISEDELVILFVGSEFKRKGLDTLIKAYALLQRKDTRLIVAGGGDIGPYVKLARNCGVSCSVLFLGLVDEMKMVYAISDVFVLPTLTDPYGMASIEAMAMGIPTITSGAKFAGSSENIEDGEAILLQDPTNPEEIAEALGTLMYKSRRVNLGRRGREVARTMTWDKTAQNTLRTYYEVLNC